MENEWDASRQSEAQYDVMHLVKDNLPVSRVGVFSKLF